MVDKGLFACVDFSPNHEQVETPHANKAWTLGFVSASRVLPYNDGLFLLSSCRFLNRVTRGEAALSNKFEGRRRPSFFSLSPLPFAAELNRISVL